MIIIEDLIILVKQERFHSLEVPTYLVNEHYEDRYFDVIDAVEEAKHIYFEGNGLLERLSNRNSSEPFIIGETGFGAGRILVSLLDYLSKTELTNLNIIYNSVELHPINADRMSDILSGFKDKIGISIDLFVEEYRKIDISTPGWSQIKLNLPFGTITLNLRVGEALEMLQELSTPCDIWFLDGHGPKKNPLMWRSELLQEVAKKTLSGGSFATFTVAGFINRELSEAGFTVEKFTGRGRKKYFLRGLKN